MQTVPYLYFNGNAEEAINLYKKALKAKEPEIMRFKDQPSPDLPAELENRVMHAEVAAEGVVIYVSDSMGEDIQVGNNVQINLNCDSEEQVRWLYDCLVEGGKVEMELQDTFWGAFYGSVTDRFGVTWSFNFQKNPMPGM